MICMFCDGDTAVINSRLQKRENSVWRRRKCQSCGTVFTTIEEADLSYSIRVASEGQTEALTPFSKPKLHMSIYECCKHLKEPENTSEALTRTVISRLLRKKSALINTHDIKQITFEVLHRFDTAAGVQYAAFHPVKS